MWAAIPSEQWNKDAKYYAKKRPSELAAILNNLHRYMCLLNSSKNARCAQAGYLHPEPAGVVAVDQKGGGGNLQETRAYTYCEEAKKVLHLITIGNKDSQGTDVQLSKKFVEGLLAEETA